MMNACERLLVKDTIPGDTVWPTTLEIGVNCGFSNKGRTKRVRWVPTQPLTGMTNIFVCRYLLAEKRNIYMFERKTVMWKYYNSNNANMMTCLHAWPTTVSIFCVYRPLSHLLTNLTSYYTSIQCCFPWCCQIMSVVKCSQPNLFSIFLASVETTRLQAFVALGISNILKQN